MARELTAKTIAHRNLVRALDLAGHTDLALTAKWGLFNDDKAYFLDRLRNKGSAGEAFLGRVNAGEFDRLWS
jgi:hypothetical protein